MAAQIELFARGPRVLADGERGTIRYAPSLFDVPASERLFVQLVDSVPWSAESMWMYDKVVTVPRLVAHFGADEAVPAALAEIKTQVEAHLNKRFNAVGLNYYRDGNDSVAWHSDRNEGLEPLSTVALVSLGAARAMLIRPKNPPRTAITCDLEAGSLLTMSGRAQEFWEHTIPKTRRPCSARISVVLRQRLSA